MTCVISSLQPTITPVLLPETTFLSLFVCNQTEDGLKRTESGILIRFRLFHVGFMSLSVLLQSLFFLHYIVSSIHYVTFVY